MSRVVSQISTNKVGIFLRGYLVDLRSVLQVLWITYLGSASGQRLFRIEQAVTHTAQRSRLKGHQ